MQVHAVKFTDRLSVDGDLQDVDALAFGTISPGQTISTIYAIENGKLELKTSVPHGSSSQGYTWH